MTDKMIKLKPNNGNGENGRWYQRSYSYVVGTLTTAGMLVGLGYISHCNPKIEPPQCPESKPAACEECCPPGHRKEVSKQPFGVMIKCIDPLTEPRCGDGKCNGDETTKTCPQDCPAPVEIVPRKVPERPAPAPAPVQTPEEEPETIEPPKPSECGRDKIESLSEAEQARYVGAISGAIRELKDTKSGDGEAVHGKFTGKVTFCKSGKISLTVNGPVTPQIEKRIHNSAYARLLKIGPRDENFTFQYEVNSDAK